MTKHIMFLTISTLVVATHIHAQAPAIAWDNAYGATNNDELHIVEPTDDGGFILGGMSPSNAGPDKSENSRGGYDYWVIKLDASGVKQWDKTIGGTGLDYLFALKQTPDGGYFLAGESESNISGDKTENLVGQRDIWVVKLNSAGTIQWQNNIGGNFYDYLRCADLTADGGYILGGSSASTISGDKTISGRGFEDYWVIKLNSTGVIQWQQLYGNNDHDWLYAIHETSDGGYILGGHSSSAAGFEKTEGTIGGYDYYVIKINSVGDVVWQNTIGGTGADMLYDLVPTADGGYIACGSSLSGIGGDKSSANRGLNNYWIVKLNATGSIEWNKTLGGSSTDVANSIIQASDGNYLVFGNSISGISGDKTEVNLGQDDYWVFKLNSTGGVMWQNTIGGNYTDLGTSICQMPDGAYLLAGSSSSPVSFDRTDGLIGGKDYWVVKLVSDCVPTTEICNSLDDDCNGLIDDVSLSVTISAGGPTTFCSGSNVLLSAVYTGTSIQWKRNGTNISGATNSNYTATLTGSYTATTTNLCNSTTSDAINVTVNKNPNASITAGGPTTFCVGGSVSLTVTPVAGCTYQWYKGATALAGATATTYVATTTGNYKCRVTKTATGCYKNSNTIAVSVTCKDGEHIDTVDVGFKVFPNPANATITIEPSSTIPTTVQVRDVFGQLVIPEMLINSQMELDVKAWPAGMYFLQFTTESDIIVSRFVKQ